MTKKGTEREGIESEDMAEILVSKETPALLNVEVKQPVIHFTHLRDSSLGH